MLNSDKGLFGQEAHSHLKRRHIHFLVWVEEGTQRQFGVQLIHLVEESLYLVFGFVLVQQQELAVARCHEAVYEQRLIFTSRLSELINAFYIHVSGLPLRYFNCVEGGVQNELEKSGSSCALVCL